MARARWSPAWLCSSRHAEIRLSRPRRLLALRSGSGPRLRRARCCILWVVHRALGWKGPFGLTRYSPRRCRILYVLIAGSRSCLRLPLGSGFCCGCSSYTRNSLSSSFRAGSPAFLLCGFSLFLHFSPLAPSVHDLRRGADIGAIDRHGTTSCTGPAIGSAPTRQV